MSFERFCIWWLMFLLALAPVVFAEPLQGYDILGLAKQDVKMISQIIEPGKAIGVLEGTFGPSIPPLEKLINSGKVIAFRVHLTNGTCQRNHNCEKGEPGPNDINAIAKRAKAFESLHLRHPEVKCFLSPRLEHDEKNKELVNLWFQKIKEFAPSCVATCSNFTGYCPASLSEKHGNDANADIVSNDGQSLFDADTSSYWNHGKIISFAWIHRFNLRLTSEKTWTPPSKRTHRVSKDDILQINALMKPVEPIPTQPKSCKVLIKIIKPELLKSNAEDYANGQPRDNRAVLLIKKKYQNGFAVISPSDKKIACASNIHNLPPLGNLNRYYLGECSNKSNWRVFKDAGSEWVFYKNGSNCFLGNAIRRLGYFRD